MNRSDEEYFENYFELFQTKGWKQFIAEIEQQLNLLKDEVFYNSEPNDFLVKRGMYLAANRFLGFETYIRSGYETI